MTSGNLPEIVASLTPGEQALVREFVDFLKAKNSTQSRRFLSAVDEFIGEHPDLLHNLAR
jgi:hypothetical protein